VPQVKANAMLFRKCCLGYVKGIGGQCRSSHQFQFTQFFSKTYRDSYDFLSDSTLQKSRSHYWYKIFL